MLEESQTPHPSQTTAAHNQISAKALKGHRSTSPLRRLKMAQPANGEFMALEAIQLQSLTSISALRNLMNKKHFEIAIIGLARPTPSRL